MPNEKQNFALYKILLPSKFLQKFRRLSFYQTFHSLKIFKFLKIFKNRKRPSLSDLHLKVKITKLVILAHY